MLSVRLRHRMGGFTLDAAFQAPAGVTALFGRSGAGKTSVIRAVAGLLRPEEGEVRVGDRILTDTATRHHLAPHRRRMGYVFQDARLLPHLSVRRNLLYGAWFRGGSGRFADVVDLLDLRPLLARSTWDLSGGERSRVALGRALLSDPALLLLDEPLAALDESRKAEVLPYLRRLAAEAEVPMLYVSHSVAEVAQLARTLVVLRDGQVQRIGPVAEVLADPEAVPALGVREAGAVLTGRVVSQDPVDGLTDVALSAGRLTVPRIALDPGAEVRLRVNAHDVTLALQAPQGLSALNILPVEVLSIREGDGPGAAVALAAGGDRLLARITRRSVRELGLRPGLTCFAILKATATARADVGER